MKIISIVGARPNLMKVASLVRAYAGHDEIESLIVHTGQHYDDNMSDLFFRQLSIPRPDINLEVGSKPRDEQIAAIMDAFAPIVDRENPDVIVVVGDVNSTVACGRVAVEKGVTLAHVEAGLRSFDSAMPEEHNRIETDSLSQLLFCTEQSGVKNLLDEGVDEARVHLVGNVMIDTLLQHREKASASRILEELRLKNGEYVVLTLHRPSNVDDVDSLERILTAVESIQRDLDVVFPIHPRTADRMREYGLTRQIDHMQNVRCTEALGYLDFLKLMSAARFVMTDSGGIQEETTILKVPCLTLRENTERPVTVEVGGNRIVGTEPERILAAYHEIMEGDVRVSSIPPMWDGFASQRIVDVLLKSMN